MPEPMSDERLAEIRTELDHPSQYALEFDAKEIARELLAEVERLRTNLAEFGRVRTHWGVQHPLRGTDYIEGYLNAGIECLQRNATTSDKGWHLVTRLVGEWREAS